MISKTKIITLWEKRYDGERYLLNLSDVPVDLLVHGNLMSFESDPGYYSENNSWDPYTEVKIQKEVTKTEEELVADRQKWEKIKAKSKEERRQFYLKLKKEFESDES